MRKPKHGANRIARMADRIYDAERCRGIRIPAAVVAFLTVVSMLIPLTVSAESVGSFSVPDTSATWTGCAPENECTIGNDGHSIAFDTRGNSSSITAQAQYSLQVSAQTGAGEGVSMPAGTLEWRIPEYLFKGRENENVGSSSLDIPACDSASDSTPWCYTVDQAKSEYVVTNHLPVTDAHSVDVTVTYTASPEKIVDKDVSQDKPYKDNGISSVHSTVTTSDGTPKQSNDITAQVDTSVTLDSVTKTSVGGLHDAWPASCPNDCWEYSADSITPPNADQYKYMVWQVTVETSGNQPATLTINDKITDNLDGEALPILFIRNPSNPGMLIPSGGTLGQPLQADINNPSESDTYYIITEYPKTADLDGAALSDKVTAMLMPSDTDEPQYGTDSATFTNTPPADFVPPESMYRLQKGVQKSQSDDVNWSSRYKYRSQSDGDDVQIDGGLTALANGENVVSNDFVNHYYANTYSLTTDSGNMSSTQSDYGKVAVRHEFIDDMFAFGDAKANEMEQDGDDPSGGSGEPLQRGFAQLQPGDYSISNIYIPRGNCFDKGCSEAGNEYKSGLTIYRYGYDWNSESWKMINDPAADDLIEIWAKAGDGRWYMICSEKASAVAAYGYQGSAYGGTAVKAVCTGKDIGAIELNLHVEITLNPTEHVKQLLHTVDQTTGNDTDKLRDAAYLTDFNTMKVYRGNVFLDSSGDPHQIPDGSQYTSDMRGFCLPLGSDSSCAPASSRVAIGQDDENDVSQSYQGWHNMFNVLPFGPQKKETGTENQGGPPLPDCLLHATAQQKLTPFKPVSVIHKSAESTVNDVAHRQWKVSWSVKANECATPVSWWEDGDCTSGKNHFFGMYVNKLNGKPQNRGTFWDLLPAGLHPDMDSIEVKGTRGEKPMTIVSADFFTNWKKSGRDMLKVVAAAPPESEDYKGNYNSDGSGMILTFDSAISYDDIWDLGHGTLDLNNVASYETGNDSISQGATNSDKNAISSGGFTDQEKAWMTGLNDNSEISAQARFLYDYASTSVSVSSASSTGLSKYVRGGQYSSWTNGRDNQVTVRAGGAYQYRLRYSTDSDTRARNIVLYDSLENYVSLPGTDDQVNDKTPRWRGTLQGVDLSRIPSDIQAKVYYSTTENLELSGRSGGNHNLTNKQIWTECTPNAANDCSAQYAGAHAIAIDLSKKTDGTDYVLSANSAVNVVLDMKAPTNTAEVKDYVERNAHAYNGVHVICGNVNTSDTKNHYLDYGYTKVGLIGDEAQFAFTKTDGTSAEHEPLSGATFRLFQWKGSGNAPTAGLLDVSKPGGNWKQYDTDLTSGENGKVDFGGLAEGTYRLVEVEAPEGFSLPDVQWQINAPRPTAETAGTKIMRQNLSVVMDSEPSATAASDKSYWSNAMSDSTSGLTLANYKVPLPSTGGPGLWCRMIGCVVFVAASMVMTGALLRRRMYARR